MDAFDIKLLAALQADGRLTNNELADRVGLSASQCSRRRAALEEAGVIARYAAVLTADAVGLGVTALIQVRLAHHSADNSRQFAALVRRLDAVLEAHSLTGEADYVLKVVVPDLKALSSLLNETLLPHESIATVRSSIVLDQLKHTTALPLRHLAG
jgi:DNA-binding Lrp family transcriptional regulator